MKEILGTRDRIIAGNGLGRAHVEFEIANYDDIVKARAGLLKPKQVRRMRTVGLVDPGATAPAQDFDGYTINRITDGGTLVCIAHLRPSRHFQAQPFYHRLRQD